ncbi:unnamed protein product [Candidula unifasciata]|uniref:Uncharacterized protein n=1 Tax=Candidula unifasciata TaxID=100452 RepID=A0A8S3ZCG1_9EUPU|nr:unnamed protein product [Candidula unifasciata]
MVYKASRPPRDFFAKVWAHTPVTCTTEEFRCSPVQCVHRSRMCDGVNDCSNGHDEFCHRSGSETRADVYAELCFRCGDGTCILPRLPRYDASYGRVLWYMCDGFSHCPDASDERQDICRGLRTGLIGSVVKCVPSDLQLGYNSSVLMWSDVLCDHVADCLHGEDESDCNRNGFKEKRIHADPVTLGVVVGILATGCILFCVIYRLKMSRKAGSRPSTSSTVDTKCTQMTSSDNDGPDVTSGGPAITQEVLTNTDLGTFIDDNAHDEGEENGYDGDASSMNSLDLRHTTV